jgi:glycerol-3-phosphate acyltransferase PlsX
VKSEVIHPLPHDRELAAQAVRQLVGKYHYSAFGGAPLLGVEGVCIICHGSSNDRAIANALGVAAWDCRLKINDKIVAELEQLPAAVED